MAYIFGLGETARVLYYQIIPAELDIRAFVADAEFCERPDWFDKFSVEPTIKPFDRFLSPGSLIYLPIINNSLRESVYNRCLSYGLYPWTQINRYAIVDVDVEIGDGSWIQAGSTVQTGSRLGRGVIAWANSHIGHSSKIGNFCWITSQACICGGVTLGDKVFVGAGAIIYPDVKVSENCIIGAGAIITKDTKPNTIYIEGRNKIL